MQTNAHFYKPALTCIIPTRNSTTADEHCQPSQQASIADTQHLSVPHVSSAVSPVAAASMPEQQSLGEQVDNDKAVMAQPAQQHQDLDSNRLQSAGPGETERSDVMGTDQLHSSCAVEQDRGQEQLEFAGQLAEAQCDVAATNCDQDIHHAVQCTGNRHPLDISEQQSLQGHLLPGCNVSTAAAQEHAEEYASADAAALPHTLTGAVQDHAVLTDMPLQHNSSLLEPGLPALHVKACRGVEC